jgi:transposase
MTSIRETPKGEPMKPLAITEQQQADLQDIVARSVEAKERSRAQAILWLSEGQPASGIARRLQVSRQTVYQWMNRFCGSDVPDVAARLQDAPTGRPRKAIGIIDPLLSDFVCRDPRELGYSSSHWTLALLARHLKRSQGIEVSVTSVSLALDRLKADGCSLGADWSLSRRRASRRERAGTEPVGFQSAAS